MRWGLVATIKAPARDILAFVAYHLELGADRIYIYLDDRNEKAQRFLKKHPKVTVVRTDDAYWQSLGRKKPGRHQPRQTANATQAYRQSQGLDWLAHIDVDEFLCPARPIRSLLGALPTNVVCARVRPAEALVSEGVDGLDPATTYCKAWMPGGGDGTALEQKLYPNFGGILQSGFVSHVVGKIFVRTGLPDLDFRIHRGLQNGVEITPKTILEGVDLCHRHISSWDGWQDIMSFRMNKGSYRSQLKPARRADLGGMSMHDLLVHLRDQAGPGALRAFYDEVCLARPELIDALRENGLLRVYQLELERLLRKHFPDFE